MLDELEVEILHKMQDIPTYIYELVVHNFVDWLDRVIEANGDHLENYK